MSTLLITVAIWAGVLAAYSLIMWRHVRRENRRDLSNRYNRRSIDNHDEHEDI